MIVQNRRIIIKLGSNILTNGGEEINKHLIGRLCDQVSDLSIYNNQVAIVSSGAVASDPKTHRSRGLRAAVGQPNIFDQYRRNLNGHGLEVAQFLINDLQVQEGKSEYTKNLLLEALSERVVPIINGHDTADDHATKMLSISADNDTLACVVAKLINATDIVIVIDKAGLLDLLGVVVHEANLGLVTELMMMARGGSTHGHGDNGMSVKLKNMFEATRYGIRAIMVPGNEEHFILRALSDEKNFGTLFTK